MSNTYKEVYKMSIQNSSCIWNKLKYDENLSTVFPKHLLKELPPQRGIFIF